MTAPARSVCVNGPRPCQWHDCRHRMVPVQAVDWVIPAPRCVLDVADQVAQGADPPEWEQIGRWFGKSKQWAQDAATEGVQRLITHARRRNLPVVRNPIVFEQAADQVFRFLRYRSDGATFTEIAEATGRNGATLRSALKKLRAEGRIARVGEERYPRWRAQKVAGRTDAGASATQRVTVTP